MPMFLESYIPQNHCVNDIDKCAYPFSVPSVRQLQLPGSIFHFQMYLASDRIADWWTYDPCIRQAVDRRRMIFCSSLHSSGISICGEVWNGKLFPMWEKHTLRGCIIAHLEKMLTVVTMFSFCFILQSTKRNIESDHLLESMWKENSSKSVQIFFEFFPLFWCYDVPGKIA